ncbi:hypothetical protein ACOME3_007669 [Neoechinorhynchus agilis]
MPPSHSFSKKRRSGSNGSGARREKRSRRLDQRKPLVNQEESKPPKKREARWYDNYDIRYDSAMERKAMEAICKMPEPDLSSLFPPSTPSVNTIDLDASFADSYCDSEAEDLGGPPVTNIDSPRAKNKNGRYRTSVLMRLVSSFKPIPREEEVNFEDDLDDDALVRHAIEMEAAAISKKESEFDTSMTDEEFLLQCEALEREFERKQNDGPASNTRSRAHR